MDVGSEQSNSHVTQIAWSPPGLAPFHRSVLSILTANGILSLWASLSDTAEPASWKRVMIVNNALAMPPGTVLRSTAWAQCMRPATNYHLAVGLDTHRKVQLLDISSPYSADVETWKAQHYLTVRPLDTINLYLPGALLSAASVESIQFQEICVKDQQSLFILLAASLGLLTVFSVTLQSEMSAKPIAKCCEVASVPSMLPTHVPSVFTLLQLPEVKLHVIRNPTNANLVGSARILAVCISSEHTCNPLIIY